ncbi:MAG: hypothetical protein HKO07_02605 [Pseudomonadales bacterium]|nr:hypothetical protein [Pseudomonadales bacterium]
MAEHALEISGTGQGQSVAFELAGSYLPDASTWQGTILPAIKIDTAVPASSIKNGTGGQKVVDESNIRKAERAKEYRGLSVESNVPIALDVSTNKPRFAIGAFCLSVNGGQLCSEGNMPQGGLAQSNTANSNSPAYAQQDLAFQLSGFDLATLRPLLPGGLQWQGMLRGSGKVAFSANATPLLQLEITGDEGKLQAGQQDAAVVLAYDSIALQCKASQTELHASLSMQQEQRPLLQTSLTLSGEKFETLSGDLTITALPLGLFAPMAPTLETLQGQIDAQLNLGGSTRAPALDGTLALSGGQVKLSNNALALSNIALNGRFNGPALMLDGGFQADKGSGKIAGNINFSDPVSGDIKLSGTQLGIRSEPLLDLLADLDLDAKIRGSQLIIDGKVAIPEGRIEIVELPANAQKLSRDVSFAEQNRDKKRGAAETLNIEANVALVLGPQLTLNGFDASATLDGQLLLTQKAGKAPTGSGEIKILEGKYRGFGQRLEVRRGSLLFNGALSEPNLNLEAIRRAEDAIAGIRVTGPAINPRIEPFSEPAMPDDQVIYRIITGRAPGGTANGGQSAIIAQTLISQGIKLGGSSLSDTAEKFGIDNFNIGTGDGSDFQVSGYLDPKLYLEYGVNALGDGSSFKLRWDFARRLSLEFIGGLASSLDLFYSREF